MVAAFEPHVGNDQLSLRQPAIARRFCVVRTAQRNGDRPDADAILRERAPFTDHWVRRLDDASGVDGEWHQRERVDQRMG